MDEIQKRILINQMEIMYALEMYSMGNLPPSVTMGLGECYTATRELLDEIEQQEEEWS